MSTPENKSYLSAGIASLNPWSPRSATPKQGLLKDGEEQGTEPGRKSQRGGDHFVGQRHRLSLKNYPKDCPPLNVEWYFAVDVPKRKPNLDGQPLDRFAIPPTPKKWERFSSRDTRAIESAFQKTSEQAEASDRDKQAGLGSPLTDAFPQNQETDDGDLGQVGEGKKSTKVPVNEDYLFDVDIESREFGPAYWLGPIYEVRRGTWFFQQGARQVPCDENLSNQLEEGYLKIRPWRFPSSEQQRSTSQPRSRPASWRPGGNEEVAKALKDAKPRSLTPEPSTGDLRGQASSDPSDQAPGLQDMATYRLFGAHMSSVVTYQDARTAWMLTDDFLSRMSSTVYQRFAGGAHFAGIKVTRGFDDRSLRDGSKDSKKSSIADSASDIEDSDNEAKTPGETDNDPPQSPSEMRRQTLERQMSSLVASVEPEDPEKQEEEVRKRDEKEIRNDYKEREGEDQGREIEHLLLVTHGIGQRLGLRMESVNFVHDVNTFRKTLKAVYDGSPDLQALNSEVDKLSKNCRVQVLPICWRHLLDFPKQSLKHNREEHDLGDTECEDDEFPTLEDITVDGVPAVRNLITDLALDILLYQSPAYKNHISRIVLQECNRIYKLFKQRNPGFNGRVSLIGHSLGSAIMFDLLCRQPQERSKWARQHSKTAPKNRRSSEEALKFDFDVEDFYALGSPIGLFQMLKGRVIAGRPTSNFIPPDTPGDSMDDPFISSQASTTFNITTSSPCCQQIFNIFHPTDPISYRLEPLISPAMATLKPQPLPYTKKGIFGTPVGQGLTGIGARVGQSVSGFWSSVSSGIASNLLNRSLGLSATDQSKLGNPIPGQQSRAPLTSHIPNALPNSAQAPPAIYLDAEERKRRLTLGSTVETIATGEDGEHPLTLIDSELETLYSGFQKRRKSQASDDGTVAGVKAGNNASQENKEAAEEWADLEEKSKKLKREEAKVRALNANGRVDYSIQEGAFDISLIASIASHLSYWADEDVSHFMISQLLARHRVIKREKRSSGKETPTKSVDQEMDLGERRA